MCIFHGSVALVVIMCSLVAKLFSLVTLGILCIYIYIYIYIYILYIYNIYTHTHTHTQTNKQQTFLFSDT